MVVSQYPFWVRLNHDCTRVASEWCSEQFGPDIIAMSGNSDDDFYMVAQVLREWNFPKELTDRIGWTFFDCCFYFLDEAKAIHFKMYWNEFKDDHAF